MRGGTPGRVWITAMLCLIGGALAAASFIVAKKPDAKKADPHTKTPAKGGH